MAKYRGGVIGLGWMGMLYDIATRTSDRFEIDDADRPTPELDIHRRIHHHEHPGDEGSPTTYAAALADRDEIDLVAAADRDVKRLSAFTERYGIDSVYTDAEEMLKNENLDIVAIPTNTKGRADLTVMAGKYGAKGIFTDKPMAHTLEEADRMVKVCADAGVALNCGAITTTHPSFEVAKNLIADGEIGEVLSISASGATAQHQNWSYFLDSPPAWAIGTGDIPRSESGSDEFRGTGMLVAEDGTTVHFVQGSTGVRITGTEGEIAFSGYSKWKLEKDLMVHWYGDDPKGKGRTEMKFRNEMPFPGPQFLTPYGAIYSLDDVMRTIAGEIEEPKNSGRRVAVAIETEIALKLSSDQGGKRIDFPVADRSLGLNYDWFR